MPREYQGPWCLNARERIVLRHLFHSDGPATSAHFAGKATVTTGRNEWALPILKRLATFGLVRTLARKEGNSTLWEITPDGCLASDQAMPPLLPRLSADALLVLGRMVHGGADAFERPVAGGSDPRRADEAIRELEYEDLILAGETGHWRLSPTGRDVRGWQVPEIDAEEFHAWSGISLMESPEPAVIEGDGPGF